VIQSVQHQVCLFPVLHKEELLRLASEGVLIPTGLTRHIIPGRALGINLAGWAETPPPPKAAARASRHPASATGMCSTAPNRP